MFVTPCHDRRTGVITVSRLAEFRAAEKALQEQMAQLEALKKDAGLKREIEFEQKLVGLMKSYDKSLRDIIAILDPKAVARASSTAPKQQRRPRVVKVYQNPHTGERSRPKAATTAASRPGKNSMGPPRWKAGYADEMSTPASHFFHKAGSVSRQLKD
jgi:hypothetical protein